MALLWITEGGPEAREEQAGGLMGATGYLNGAAMGLDGGAMAMDLTLVAKAMGPTHATDQRCHGSAML